MDAVEEVKSRLSIEDVIGEYIELKRAEFDIDKVSLGIVDRDRFHIYKLS